jgi:hypothetical protein
MRYPFFLPLLAICAFFILQIYGCKTQAKSPRSEEPTQITDNTDHQDKAVNISPEATSLTDKTNHHQVLPPVIIYKTKEDYSQYVPVVLSADHSSIVSYPDIKDIYFMGSLAYPTPLTGGYLLDNRGIDAGVAFLNYTYKEYQSLTQTPEPKDLMNHILIQDPLTEIYTCKCMRDTAILNEMIRNNDFSQCTRLK